MRDRLMIKFEDYLIPAADMGDENPMPDIKNVSYIHASCQISDRVTEKEKNTSERE